MNLQSLFGRCAWLFSSSAVSEHHRMHCHSAISYHDWDFRLNFHGKTCRKRFTIGLTIALKKKKKE